jgi:hypothetical protein
VPKAQRSSSEVPADSAPREAVGDLLSRDFDRDLTQSDNPAAVLSSLPGPPIEQTLARPSGPTSATLRPNASVDLGEEDRHAAGGEVRDVVDGRLPLLGSEARLQRVHVLERELGDALVGDRAAVRRREVDALLDANGNGGPPRLPAAAERLARDVTVMGTYDEAPDAVRAWLKAGPTRSTWCCLSESLKSAP